MQIIDGQQIALETTQRIAREIFNKALTQRPSLAIILVGDKDDSALYVDIKQARAKEVGIDTHLYKINKDETTKDIIELIQYLNQDEEVNGILVQLPLPEQYDTDKIILAIDPEKDVDCFHPENIKKLDDYKNKKPAVLPPVYATILEMLDKIRFDLKNKNSVILANSKIFGKGLQKILEEEGSKAKIVFSDDKKLIQKIKHADLLITAVGRKQIITAEMLKPNVVIIDVGISKEGGKIYGDVDFVEAKEMALAITPVPGGVGPVTVAKVLENTWELTKRQRSIK